MGKVIVKLITNEVIKISTVKVPPAVVDGAVVVHNHLGEVWTFSLHTIVWVQFIPSDTDTGE